jgi:phosphatidylglycerophosphate synthase
MTRIAALIVRGVSPIRFAGLDLADRATRIARRAGIESIQTIADDRPFAEAPDADLLLVLPERTIIEPKLVLELIERAANQGWEGTVVVDERGNSLDVLLLARSAVNRIRAVPRLRSAVRRLAILDVLRPMHRASRFCRHLRDVRQLAAAEAEYLWHTNGGDGEGVFTRNVRRCSIPLSCSLLKLSITPNEVTLAGFALAMAAGVAFAVGGYWYGVAGAMLYATSMVCDCSDGEVARATLADSKFGAWLETVTDYLSYFVVLGGIVYGDVRREGFCTHAAAAIVAAIASLAIVTIVGYLRARVAAENPGGFDDALAADMREGTSVQRFAVWSRQLIKRSFLAHLVLFQALINRLPALTEIWAYGSIAALVVVVAVQTHIARNVRPESLRPAVTV